MGYIANANIHAFPVATRGAGYPYARLTTERNLTQNLRAFTSKDGFVVTEPSSISNTDTIIAFVIYGYYFEATASDIITAAGTSFVENDVIYAHIKTAPKTGTSGIEANQTQQLDTEPQSLPGGKFGGVLFDTDSVQEGMINIPIMQKGSVDWTIHPEYCYRVNNLDVDLVWEPLTAQA